ncbi:MAG: biosynthetic-type acetolactate synthase large subunit, partial [Myxococcota bacterium]
MVLEKDLKRGAFPLTGAQHVWRCLEQEGVEVCFGYPGGAIMPVYDALPESSIHHVLCRHEQGAAHMADGYARATGRVGVALATSGPGATNLVTGIATAMLDSVPLVCITGQVPSHLLGTDAFQETDITGITMPITKHNYRVTRPEDVAPAIRDAFRVARSGRPGPVLIDITKDAQIGTCDIEAEAPARPLEPPDHPEPPGAALDAAAELINSAVRPLILAGHGVIQAEATGELLALAERADLPITTTLLGLGGVPASHPLHLGMPGMHGAATVNRAIQAADVLIAVGMRFDDRVTGNVSRFAPQARIIHLEIDPAEIGKNVSTDVGVLGDARASLRGLLKRVGPASHAAWRSQLAAWQADDNARDLLQRPDPEAFHAAHVMHDLWRYTQGDALIVSDVGQHQMWEAQYHPHEAPRTLLTSGGLGTMG